MLKSLAPAVCQCKRRWISLCLPRLRSLAAILWQSPVATLQQHPVTLIFTDCNTSLTLHIWFEYGASFPHLPAMWRCRNLGAVKTYKPLKTKYSILLSR
jgi:hypothetical protein